MSASGRPSILGGEPIVTADHGPALRWPILTSADEEAILAILRSANLSTHTVIRDLEQDYRGFTGMPHALAHCNGTAAMLAAFHAIDLQPGDEVLVPSATFWASVLPMIWLGAVPVFCESEAERMGLDPADLEQRITSRTRALVVVHLWGLPGKMTEILAVARRQDLKVVEDASHAHGAVWRGRRCGSLGDVAVFSLQGDKLAPAGEGGVLLCRDEQVFEKAVCLGDITRILELESPARRFAATSFGVKTRIAPLSAAVARVQLRQLEERNRKRNQNVEYLSSALQDLGFHTYPAPPHIRRVYFEFLVRPDPERVRLPLDSLIKALKAEGCRVSSPRYPLLHQQPFFTEGHFRRIARLPPSIEPPSYAPDALPATEREHLGLVRLPTFPSADRVILDQYVEAFRKVIENSDGILAA